MGEPLSPKNSEVARLRGLSRNRRDRRAAGRFVVEGTKLVVEVLQSSLDVRNVFVAEGHEPAASLSASLSTAGMAVIEVAPGGIERMASTVSPQPVIAEVVIPSIEWDDLAGSGGVVVVVDVNDPGNMGTLARSAEAAGFAGLVVLGASADPWGPKAVRAGAGSLFRLPVIVSDDIGAGLSRLSPDFELVGTRMAGAPPCDRTDLTGRIALVLGGEAHGLPDAAAEVIATWVSIPMSGRVESLNVAMAGTILTYEVARQRRRADR